MTRPAEPEVIRVEIKMSPEIVDWLDVVAKSRRETRSTVIGSMLGEIMRDTDASEREAA